MGRELSCHFAQKSFAVIVAEQSHSKWGADVCPLLSSCTAPHPNSCEVSAGVTLQGALEPELFTELFHLQERISVAAHHWLRTAPWGRSCNLPRYGTCLRMPLQRSRQQQALAAPLTVPRVELGSAPLVTGGLDQEPEEFTDSQDFILLQQSRFAGWRWPCEWYIKRNK